jgi:transcriptional antiterminator RfaH
MLHWYALHTKPHKETQVASFLRERGIEIYFPTMPAPSHLHAHRERAFFASYLFAHADLAQTGVWPIHYAPGMCGLVMSGGVPAEIHETVISLLRARLSRINVVDGNGEALTYGDSVRITSGPLADLDAIFDQRLSAAGRVLVLIQLAQRWTKVEIDAAHLSRNNALSHKNRICLPA